MVTLFKAIHTTKIIESHLESEIKERLMTFAISLSLLRGTSVKPGTKGMNGYLHAHWHWAERCWVWEIMAQSVSSSSSPPVSEGIMWIVFCFGISRSQKAFSSLISLYRITWKNIILCPGSTDISCPMIVTAPKHTLNTSIASTHDDRIQRSFSINRRLFYQQESAFLPSASS